MEMNHAEPKSLKVMISSTVRDLEEYRDAVSEVLDSLTLHAVKMELLGADSRTPLDVSLGLVGEADVYVGIVAHRYGSSPPGCEKSFTELEYDEARRLDRDCLIFILSDNTKVLPATVETGDGAERLRAFKSSLMAAHKVSFFEDLGTLKYNLRLSLDQYLGVSSRAARLQQPARDNSDPALVSLDSAMEMLPLVERVREFERRVEQGDFDGGYKLYWRAIEKPLFFGDWPCTERIRLLRMLLGPEGAPTAATGPNTQRSRLLHSLGLAELDAGAPLAAVDRFSEALRCGLGVNSAADRVASQCGLAEGLISLGRLKEASDLLEALCQDNEATRSGKRDELLLVSWRLLLLRDEEGWQDLSGPSSTRARERGLSKVFQANRVRAEHALLVAIREDSGVWDQRGSLEPHEKTANRRDVSGRAAWFARQYLFAKESRPRELRALERARGERLMGFARTLIETPQDRLAGKSMLYRAESKARELGLTEERLACHLGLARAAGLDGRLEEERRILGELAADAEKNELRLLEADALNAMALCCWRAGEADAAKSSALKAYDRSWCDGPPFAYSWGLRIAQRLLERLMQSPKRPTMNPES